MKCINPNCNYCKTEAIDSRELKEGYLTRRRRYCCKCQTRYTTLEIPIYLGLVNRDSHHVLQQVINFFSVNDPYTQWQHFFRFYNTDPYISHSQES